MITEINEIDTTTKEGKYLLMSLAAITTSPKVALNGKIRDGRKMTPFEAIAEIGKVVARVFNSDQNVQASVATDDDSSNGDGTQKIIADGNQNK